MASTERVDKVTLARAASALRSLGCTRSDAVALALLALAALAGLGLLWWVARPGVPVSVPDDVDVDGGIGGADPEGAGAVTGGLDVRRGAVVVHVAGHVRAPGLYELPGGSRVADALAAAGGALDGALLDTVNLARPLSDGEQLRVPGPDDVVAATGGPGGRGGGAGSGSGAPAGPSAWRPDGTLDLNLAAASDLEELPGIGPVLAERIIAYREQHGPFTSVGQLRQVSGIGERTFQGLADLVTV